MVIMNDLIPDDFDSPVRGLPTADEDDAFVVNIGGFEGPLDMLLQMARTQKVDLKHISILALVEQYLTFINQARILKLELAADYLVMAAWLAWLKSRLLLPKEDAPENEPSAQELAARLQLQLQRLEAIRDVGTRLMGRSRLGRDVFLRGCPEPLQIIKHRAFDVTLYELLKAYGDVAARQKVVHYTPQRRAVFGLEAAIERLQRLIGTAIDWTEISTFLPPGADVDFQRSALASTFVASLEMARIGRAELQQTQAFGPLYVRQRDKN
jgi:segregation and condensation protein A